MLELRVCDSNFAFTTIAADSTDRIWLVSRSPSAHYRYHKCVYCQDGQWSVWRVAVTQWSITQRNVVSERVLRTDTDDQQTWLDRVSVLFSSISTLLVPSAWNKLPPATENGFLDVVSSYLQIRYISRDYRSSLYMKVKVKVTGAKKSKIHVPAM